MKKRDKTDLPEGKLGSGNGKTAHSPSLAERQHSEKGGRVVMDRKRAIFRESTRRAGVRKKWINFSGAHRKPMRSCGEKSFVRRVSLFQQG